MPGTSSCRRSYQRRKSPPAVVGSGRADQLDLRRERGWSAHPRHQHTVTGRLSVGASHLPPGYSALTCHVPPVTLTKMSSKQPFASVLTVRYVTWPSGSTYLRM